MSLYASWTTYTDARNYVSHVTEGYVDAVSDEAINAAARTLWKKLGQGEHTEKLENMDVVSIIDSACMKFPV
jgi:nitroimidazol reductase NimA-like FMN-containing flavoprotein (pyridoxamine 5'-phosphate oxidase superfamily)